MKLWTTQSPEVYEIVMKDGYCIVDPDKSLWLDIKQFKAAYDWIVMKMDEKIKRPLGVPVFYPWWAYYKVDGHYDIKLEDINYRDTPGTTMVALELEVPDEEVLLSDLDAWNFVLNDLWIDDSTDEVSWNKCLKYYRNLPLDVAKEVKVNSWDKVFDLTPVVTDWKSNGQEVQGTFWMLRKEYIKSATTFVVQELTGVD